MTRGRTVVHVPGGQAPRARVWVGGLLPGTPPATDATTTGGRSTAVRARRPGRRRCTATARSTRSRSGVRTKTMAVRATTSHGCEISTVRLLRPALRRRVESALAAVRLHRRLPRPGQLARRRRLHWQALLQARAIENQAYVVGVNRGDEAAGWRTRRQPHRRSRSASCVADAARRSRRCCFADISRATATPYEARDHFRFLQDPRPRCRAVASLAPCPRCAARSPWRCGRGVDPRRWAWSSASAISPPSTASTSRSAAARRSASSDRTAPASPRRCG